MKIIDRLKQPTPTFLRKLRNIGIALAATGGAIIAAPISLPAKYSILLRLLLWKRISESAKAKSKCLLFLQALTVQN